MLREMLRIRRFEEKCAELYSLGKIRGILHLYKRCPIANFIEWLRAGEMLTDDELFSIESSVTNEIDEAVAFAEAGAWEPIEGLLKDVYTTPKGDD